MPTNDQKAFLLTETGTRVPCAFNPSQIGISRSNNWTATPGAGAGVAVAEYGGAQSGTMNLELLFDSTDTGKAVTDSTSVLLGLMEVSVMLPGEAGKRPEWVEFHWGDLISFRAVITNLSLTFVYFSSKGVPLRARATLALMQYDPVVTFGKQNPTSGTPNPHGVHRVLPGETLDRIAADRYKDSTKWRAIAAANGIEDPLALSAGAVLSIPRLEP